MREKRVLWHPFLSHLDSGVSPLSPHHWKLPGSLTQVGLGTCALSLSAAWPVPGAQGGGYPEVLCVVHGAEAWVEWAGGILRLFTQGKDFQRGRVRS